jgi:hypothetical protein
VKRAATSLATTWLLLVAVSASAAAQSSASAAVRSPASRVQAFAVGVITPLFAGSSRGIDSTSARPPRQSDTFLGPDKVKHFLLSGFIEAVGFSGLELAGADRHASLVTATAVTAAAGIGREIHDLKTKGLFSLGDLTWDALGTGAALLMLKKTAGTR